jgi:hypothetical protein
VSADKHKDIRPPSLGLLGQVDDLRDVGEVIAGKRDHVGPPVVDRPQVTALALDLEIEQPDLMPGLTRRLRNQLQTERLQAEKDLGVQERAGMHGEQSHFAFPPLLDWANRSERHPLGNEGLQTPCEGLPTIVGRARGEAIMLYQAYRALDQDGN